MVRKKTIRDKIQSIFELIETGYPEREYEYSKTPLHDAAMDGNVAAIDAIIANGEGIDSQKDNGESPLNVAIQCDSVEAVKALVAAGADLELPDSGGYTPLKIAALYENFAVVDILVSAGANVNDPNADINDNSLLHTCVEKGDVELVKKVIAAGAHLDLYDRDDEYRMTPLQLAALFKHYAVMDVLVSTGANVNLPNGDGETLLFRMTWEEEVENVEMLIEAGADPDLSDQDGSTPLHIAAVCDNAQILKLLISAGANVSLKNANGETALKIAQRRENRESIELLKQFAK